VPVELVRVVVRDEVDFYFYGLCLVGEEIGDVAAEVENGRSADAVGGKEHRAGGAEPSLFEGCGNDDVFDSDACKCAAPGFGCNEAYETGPRLDDSVAEGAGEFVSVACGAGVGPGKTAGCDYYGQGGYPVETCFYEEVVGCFCDFSCGSCVQEPYR